MTDVFIKRSESVFLFILRHNFKLRSSLLSLFHSILVYRVIFLTPGIEFSHHTFYLLSDIVTAVYMWVYTTFLAKSLLQTPDRWHCKKQYKRKQGIPSLQTYICRRDKTCFISPPGNSLPLVLLHTRQYYHWTTSCSTMSQATTLLYALQPIT